MALPSARLTNQLHLLNLLLRALDSSLLACGTGAGFTPGQAGSLVQLEPPPPALQSSEPHSSAGNFAILRRQFERTYDCLVLAYSSPEPLITITGQDQPSANVGGGGGGLGACSTCPLDSFDSRRLMLLVGE